MLRRQELNPHLLVLETSALPIELLPNYLVAGSGFAPLIPPHAWSEITTSLTCKTSTH